MNEKRQKFLTAVSILAPGDNLILQAAQRVSEERLPAAPGAAALGFVVAIQRMRGPVWACKGRFKRTRSATKRTRDVAPSELALEDALKIKSAAFWLKLGQPDQALLELKSLAQRLQKHPSVLEAYLAAAQDTRELKTHQE